jgi:hypothetical protein
MFAHSLVVSVHLEIASAIENTLKFLSELGKLQEQLCFEPANFVIASDTQLVESG